MVFSSLPFLFRFLPVVLVLYYVVPDAWKNSVLFIGSLIFYCWGEIRFFPILLVVVLINYCCGLLLERTEEKPVLKKIILIFGISASLSFLLYFKYSAFLGGIFGINNSSGLIWKGTLPLGISFYTFQAMSYVIDLYRGKAPVEKNIITFGSYIVMFPQLIAGPIVKYSAIHAQLRNPSKRVTTDRLETGAKFFIVGLAQKVLLADGIGKLWSDIIGVYQNGVMTQAGVGLTNASTGLAWLGIAAYSMQLYFDFNGYSMMGIGLGKMLGFDFPDNFKHPYISSSITEFWRRWHITLSGWFRDYVYIPLGGNKLGIGIQLRNLLIVWLLTGIWHGAGWNFVAWGMYYFILLVIEKLWLLPFLKKGRIWPHIYTLFLVVFGWGLFVSGERGVGLSLLLDRLFCLRSGVSVSYFLRNYCVILTVSVLCCTSLPEKCWKWMEKHRAAQIIVLGLLLAVSVCYLVGTTNSPFLYFNF